MNVTPIARPLAGEHLLATSPILAPEAEAEWHRRLNFWSGRALTADALEDEQRHRSGHLGVRGTPVTPGVVSGLGVSLLGSEPVATPNLAGSRIRIEPGLGLTAGGDQVVVPRTIEVALGEVAWRFLDDDGQPRPFNPANPEEEFNAGEADLPASFLPWAAVVLFQPAEVILIENRGADEPCELDPDADAFADPRRVECAQLRLCVLPPIFLPAALGSGEPADPTATWRNRLAVHLMTKEAERFRRLEGGEFQRENEAAPWERLGVPLGLVSFAPDLTEATRLRLFLDRTSVVRPAGRPRPRPRPGRAAAAGSPALWQARIRQFAEHLGDLTQSLAADAATMAQHFRFLPPAGLLPGSALTLLNTEEARLFAPPQPGRPSDRAGTTRFFPAQWSMEASPVPQDELDAALALSAPLASFDLSATETEWVRLLVPVSRADFEPELLVVAEPDSRVEQELVRLVDVRQDWLWRRKTVRDRSSSFAHLISGQDQVFPSLEADPARTDDEEKAPRQSPLPPVLTTASALPVFRSPQEIREVASFHFALPAGTVILAGATFLFPFQIDREAPPEAVRIILETPGAVPLRALIWANPGIDPRWGTALETETGLGPVPVPGQWLQFLMRLPGEGQEAVECRGVRLEVLRGSVAIGLGMLLGSALISGVTPPEDEWAGWTRVPNAAVIGGPFENAFEPVFSDNTTLESRLDEFDTAFRAGVPRKRAAETVNDVVLTQDEPRLIDALGLEPVLRQFADEADEAEDFIDLNFTRTQTNLYRIRKFILGENAAQKLLINPALAVIAEQETATANAEQLTAFVASARARTKISAADIDKALGRAPANPRAANALLDIREISNPNIRLIKEVAQPPPPRLTLNPVGGFEITQNTSFPRFQFISLEDNAAKFNATNQLPEAGPGLPPRGLAIGKRFEEPKSTENLRYARSALTQVLGLLPKLRLPLVGESLRSPDNTTDIELVRLQGRGPTGSILDANAREADRQAAVQALLNFPATANEADEAEVTFAALDLTEIKTALLRRIERVVQQRRLLLDRLQETIRTLTGMAQLAAQRLFALDTQVAEARHDVTVARALWQEEKERTANLNAHRDEVIARVRFFAYIRPRTVTAARRNTPSAPVDRPEAPQPVPECLARHDQPPEELSEYVGLFRHSPARWFTDLTSRIAELDTPDRVVRLLKSAKSAASRFRENTVPSNKTRSSPAAVSRVFEKRVQSLAQNRLQTAQLGIFAAADLSWIQYQQLASEHATLGDLIEAAHGRTRLAGEAAALLDQVREVATCLHAEFAAVTPALRLAWTERLSQFDAEANLRDLSILPRWGELSRTARRRFQAFTLWLFQRVNAAEPEALDLINDLVRLVLLLASHAPVNQLIAGHIPRPAPVSVGTLVLVKPFDPGLVRAGMEVVIWDQARVVARAQVEDLRNGDTAVRIHQVADKVTGIDPKMRVQYLANGAKTSRAVK